MKNPLELFQESLRRYWSRFGYVFLFQTVALVLHFLRLGLYIANPTLDMAVTLAYYALVVCATFLLILSLTEAGTDQPWTVFRKKFKRIALLAFLLFCIGFPLLYLLTVGVFWAFHGISIPSYIPKSIIGGIFLFLLFTVPFSGLYDSVSVVDVFGKHFFYLRRNLIPALGYLLFGGLLLVAGSLGLGYLLLWLGIPDFSVAVALYFLLPLAATYLYSIYRELETAKKETAWKPSRIIRWMHLVLASCGVAYLIIFIGQFFFR